MPHSTLRHPPRLDAPADRVGWVDVARGTTRWQCAADWEHRLLDGGGLKLREWESNGRVDVIKTGPHRTVWRVAAEGGLYVKQYRVAGWLQALQHLVRRSRAELEFEAARHVRDAGIATFEPLAVGVARRGRLVTGSWLVTREITGVVPVDEMVESLRRRDDRAARRVRSQLARGLGEIVARLHAAGLLHRDLHAGNFLARIEPDESVALWLVDLHAVDAPRRLSLTDVEWNLAQLNNFFVRRATRSERLRFLRTLLLAPPLRKGGQGGWRSKPDSFDSSLGSGSSLSPSYSHLTLRDAALRFSRYCDRAVLDTYRRGDAKWRSGNRRLIVADNSEARCRGLAELGRAFLEQLRGTGDPERLASSAARSPHERLAPRVALFAPPARWLDRLLRRFGNGDAARAWEMGHALLRRGIPAVRPLAFVESKSGTSRSALLLDDSGDPTLAEVLSRRSSNRRAGSPREESRLVELLARVVRRMHDIGFVHRRLVAGNVRVSWEDHEIRLDGLQAIVQPGRVDRDAVASQLALLAGSLEPRSVRLTERLRFLRGYAGWQRREERRTLWMDVELRMERAAVVLPRTETVRRAA